MNDSNRNSPTTKTKKAPGQPSSPSPLVKKTLPNPSTREQQLAQLGPAFSGFKALAQDWSKTIQEADSQVKKAFLPFQEFLKRISEFRIEIEQYIAPILEGLKLAVERLPDATRKDLTILGTQGWCISSAMPITFPREVAHKFQEGNIKEANGMMMAYYEENLSSIRKSLIENFPARAKILSRAFDAHDQGWYELSVPVLLAQADGIFFEIIGFQSYKRKRNPLANRKKFETFLMGNEHTMTAAFLELFLIPLPLTEPTGKGAGKPDQLNRHAVLHGMSTTYGTRINSYKAISFIDYVADWLPHLVKMKRKKEINLAEFNRQGCKNG